MPGGTSRIYLQHSYSHVSEDFFLALVRFFMSVNGAAFLLFPSVMDCYFFLKWKSG